MREILFRGKRLDNGEWVQGANILILSTSGVYIANTGDKILTVSDTDGRNIVTTKGKMYEVAPETVGQFTGLTDKNGTKIFEGDVVKDAYVLGKVIYNTEQEDFDGAASFMIDDIFDGPQSYRFWSSVEVIGNIHDNPELIGGTDNG